MSTSDRDRGGAMGSLLDADLIARMANELFSALPGQAAPAGPASAPPTPAIPGPSFPSGQGSPPGASPSIPFAPLQVPYQAISPRLDAVPSTPPAPSPQLPVDPASLAPMPVVPPAAAVSFPSERDLRAPVGALAGGAGAPPPVPAAAMPSFSMASLQAAHRLQGDKGGPSPSVGGQPPLPLPSFANPFDDLDLRFDPRAPAPSSSSPAPPVVPSPAPYAPPPARETPVASSASPPASGATSPRPPSSLDPSTLPVTVAAVTEAPHMPAVPPVGLPGSSVFLLHDPALARVASPVHADGSVARPESLPVLGLTGRQFDVRRVRRDFPILEERVNGRPLVWLDNAATTQKPNAVIDRLSAFYRHEYSNIHRGAHTLAARATDAFEGARETVRRFLHASSNREIVFVRGTTEGINLVAKTYGRRHVEKDDEIVVTWLEHHANIVPWQMLCAEKGARLRVAPVDDRGQVILEEYEKLLGPRTRIVAVSQVSNALGTVTPVREMVEMAHRHGARVLVDGAQAVSHFRVDVQDLDADFYVFSGHKIFAPSGIGAVYGKADLLDAMPPWQGGGNMISCVSFEKTTYQAAPARFEAGTPSIADAVGLGAALDYFESVGIEAAAAYEHELLRYATAGLVTIPGLRMIGTAHEKVSVLSFVLEGFRSEDVGAALDKEGIAVRAGHHCAQPILQRFGVEATVRPSLAFYNTCEDVDALVTALRRIQAGRGYGKV